MKKYQYELILFLLLFMRLYQLIPGFPNSADYICFQYLITYKLGFVGRGFIGTLIAPFFPYITKEVFWCIFVALTLLLILIFVLFVSWGIKKLPDTCQCDVFMLVIVFILSPASIAFTFSINNFGRFDSFLIMYAIITAYFLSRNFKITPFLIPIISGIGLLTHPVFIFLYMPVSVSLLLYKSFFAKDQNIKWRICLGVNIFVVIILFCVFHYFHLVNPSYNTDIAFDFIQNRTSVNLENEKQYIHYWYFKSASDLLQNTVQPFPSQKYTLIITCIFLFPLIYALFYIWKVAIQNEKTSKKWILLMMAISEISSLPCFILEIDYGRWLASIFICQFLILLSLLIIGDENVQMGITALIKKIHDNKIYAIGSCFYLTTLGVFMDVSTLEISSRLYTFIVRFINHTLQ